MLFVNSSSVHLYSHALTKIFNDCEKSGNFPDILKYADITPVFKKGDATGKSNYRPIIYSDQFFYAAQAFKTSSRLP